MLKENNLFYAPVPVKRLVKNLNVEIKPDELGDEISGLLVIENNRAVIGYNSDEPTVRQRFTLAHEIGHYIIHCNKSTRDKISLIKLCTGRIFLVAVKKGKKCRQMFLQQAY